MCNCSTLSFNSSGNQSAIFQGDGVPTSLCGGIPYIVEIDTRILGTGTTNDDQISFPVTQMNIGGGFVEWGDGTSQAVSGTPGNILHTYPAPGVYRISCCNMAINRWQSNADRVKLTRVVRWGQYTWQSLSNAYPSCPNLTNMTCPDVPILANGANMDFFLDGTNVQPNCENWNVSGVQRFESCFRNNTVFNANISGWNPVNAWDYDRMFQNATAFNRDLSGWNISAMTSAAQFMLGKSSANFSPTFLANMYAAWSALSVSPGVTISFGGIEYIAAIGAAGRAVLAGAPNNWIITDGGAI